MMFLSLILSLPYGSHQIVSLGLLKCHYTRSSFKHVHVVHVHANHCHFPTPMKPSPGYPYARLSRLYYCPGHVR